MTIMLLDVKCTLLYGAILRSIYIELPRQEPRHGDGSTMRMLKKAMNGIRAAPQIWAEAVKENMIELEVRVSELHPSVY